MVRLKRVYDPPEEADGVRVLVDLLWPRGLARGTARIDLWLQDIAPSDALRKWYRHEPARWPAFRRRYRAELEANPEALAELRGLARGRRRLTLLCAAKDAARSNAAVLLSLLRRR